MMSTSLTNAAAAQGTAATPAVQAAHTDAAGTAAAAGTQPAAQAPFAQWLGQQAAGSGAQNAAALAGALAALTQSADGAPAADAAAAATDAATPAAEDDGTATQDNTLLAAMAMPLMPLSPMQIAQAVQIAQGGNASGTDSAAAGGDARLDTAPAVTAVGQAAARRADIALPQAATPAAASGATQPRQDDGAVRLSVQAAAHGTAGASTNAGSGSGAGSAGADAGSQDGGAAATATPLVAAAPAAANATPQTAADTVKLAGPPTAWRQSLQEALGDRLHLQVGKNVEQAVIRLEPPQLGRIDIAIRHSNGTLEVNISATNGEVLRQLQTVSDNLRNDLSQRQYTEVAVSVTPAPKSNGAAPFGDPQQQGRGRQQSQEQDEPGRALAEAGNASSVFSLGGREA